MGLITTSEAAERLKLTRSRIYQLIEDGKLVAEKIGRDYLVNEQSLKNVTVHGKAGRPPKAKPE